MIKSQFQAPTDIKGMQKSEKKKKKATFEFLGISLTSKCSFSKVENG